jgi:glycosyltransferase involved in cell wall biosynthesis
LLQLSSLLHRLRPSAVLAQLDAPNLLGGMAGVLAGVPRIVMSFRNYNPTRFAYLANAWFQPLYATLARSPRVRLSGNSRAGNEDYAQWIGCSKEAVALVPNAIEADDFVHDDRSSLETLRADHALEADAPVILGVFRLSEEKRPLTFIEVCARVAEEVPALRILIAGVGPCEGAMRRRIAELGLESRISLLGRRHDVSGLLATASLLLLTSAFEGMPNIVMEAQSAGVPVVASRVGGVPDCVVDGVTGFVLDLEDTRGFVSCCVQLLGDSALRARMGAAAADSMRRFFSKTALAERYLRVANSLDGAAIRDRTPSAPHAPLPAEQCPVQF